MVADLRQVPGGRTAGTESERFRPPHATLYLQLILRLANWSNIKILIWSGLNIYWQCYNY